MRKDLAAQLQAAVGGWSDKFDKETARLAKVSPWGAWIMGGPLGCMDHGWAPALGCMDRGWAPALGCMEHGWAPALGCMEHGWAPALGCMDHGWAPALGCMVHGWAPALGCMDIGWAPALGCMDHGWAPALGCMDIGRSAITPPSSASRRRRTWARRATWRPSKYPVYFSCLS